MTEELSERVETVYADVFHYPLILALLLLVVQTFVSLASRKLATGAVLLAVLGLSGCDRFEDAVFSRYSPDVDEALANIASHDAGDAHAGLAEYLSTGKCTGGEIGTPDTLRQFPNAAYDLGLALFDLSERFGGKLGQPPSNDPNAAAVLAKRSREVDCALRVTRLVAFTETNPIELRAKAFFLSGNLEFLRHDYGNAVSSYDDALRLIPGGLTADPNSDLAADAAFNRAIALRLQEEEEKNKPKRPDGGANSGDRDQNTDDKNDDQKDKQDDEEKRDENQQKDQEDTDTDKTQADKPQRDQKDGQGQQEHSKDDAQQDPPKPEPSTRGSTAPQQN